MSYPGATQSSGQQSDSSLQSDSRSRLSRELYFFHIFGIGISGVIAYGLYHDSGLILHIAGPAGTITAFGFVWLVAIAVMEGVGEMVGLWPVPVAFYEFVKVFVDKDFALLIGIAYWYTYAVGTQSLIIATASVVDYWGMSDMLKGLVLFLGAPVGLLAINLLGVKVYGNVELIAAILKIIFFFVSFAISLALNYGDIGTRGPIHAQYIDDKWAFNPAAVSGTLTGLAAAISLAMYAFIGIELVAITAFEAHTRSELRQPLRTIAWAVGAIYFVGVATFVSNVRWCDQHLPSLWDQPLPAQKSCYNVSSPAKRDPMPVTLHIGNSLVVIALSEANASRTASVVNAFIMVMLLSAANTSLYVASRTLFGLTRKIDSEAYKSWLPRNVAGFLRRCGTSHGSRKTPSMALIFSWVPFCWLPFYSLSKGQTPLRIQGILGSQGSIACLIVWASQCFAFIVYYNRLWKHRRRLNDGKYRMYNRWNPNRPGPTKIQSTSGQRNETETHQDVPHTRATRVKTWWSERKRKFKTKREKKISKPVASWLASGQPLVATFGLVACLVIIFGLSTATWWDGNVTVTRVVSVYLLPVLMPSVWVLLKISRAGGPVSSAKKIFRQAAKAQNPFRRTRGRNDQTASINQGDGNISNDSDWEDLEEILSGLTALAEDNMEYGTDVEGTELPQITPEINENLFVLNDSRQFRSVEELGEIEDRRADRTGTQTTSEVGSSRVGPAYITR